MLTHQTMSSADRRVIGRDTSDESFCKLMQYKIGNGFRRFPAMAYLLFSEYKLEKVLGNGETPIVFFEDLVERPDHLAMLEKIHAKTDDLTRLLIFKRHAAFPRNLLKKNLQKNLNEIWENYINGKKKVIIFCPHTLAGYWIQEVSVTHGMDVYALQHGYYSYSELENRIFSEATRSTKAYIFHEKFKDFFKNCQSVEVTGEYFSSQRRLPCVVDGLCFHVPFLNDANREFTKSVIRQYRDASACMIRHHPHQDTTTVLSHLGEVAFQHDSTLPGNGTVGRVNHFVETSTWHGFTHDGSYCGYFHRVNEPVIETTNFDDEKTQSNLIQAIRRDIYVN